MIGQSYLAFDLISTSAVSPRTRVRMMIHFAH